jgi:tripartite-type tricarboxylate transporter receptor subunit TctC
LRARVRARRWTCGCIRDGSTAEVAVVPDFEASTWSALFAPAGTPAEIVDLLNREIRAFMATPAQQERMAATDSLPLDLSPAQFAEFIQRESNAWGELIRTAKITL